MQRDFLMDGALSIHSSLWLQLTIQSKLETKTESRHATLLFNLRSFTTSSPLIITRVPWEGLIERGQVPFLSQEWGITDMMYWGGTDLCAHIQPLALDCPGFKLALSTWVYLYLPKLWFNLSSGFRHSLMDNMKPSLLRRSQGDIWDGSGYINVFTRLVFFKNKNSYWLSIN